MKHIKKLKLIITTLLILGIFSCDKDDSYKYPYGEGNGKTVFFIKTDFGAGAIDIYVDNNLEGTITKPTEGACNTTQVWFIGKTGSHKINAKSSTGLTWDGTFSVYENRCESFVLNR